MTRTTLAERLSRVSLLSKITAVTVFILTLGLFVAGAGTLAFLKPQLAVNEDEKLKQLLVDPTSELAVGANPQEIRREDVLFASDQYYIAVLDEAGNILFDNFQSRGSRVSPSVPEISAHWVEQNGDTPFTLDGRDGSQWRAVAAELRPQGSSAAPVGSMLFAVSTDNVNQVMAQYLTVFTGFGIAVILLGAALTRLLVIATFEPLHEVERTALEIADGDFSKRIQVRAPGTEVGHLGQSLNVMLDEIDASFNDRSKTIEQMRRFVGDAGHELRTPLVSVRGYAELYRMGAIQTPEDVAQAMGRIESEAIRMGDLVEDLLALARLDEKRPLDLQPVNLVPLAQDAAMDARAQEPDREIEVVIDDDPVIVRADEMKVRQVLTNLIANAMRHTPDGSPIEVVVSALPGKTTGQFEIVDHGDGIPEQLRDKIFDRFYRADNSRNRETGGSGLGLAIVKSIAEAHRGAVSAHETDGGGATFRVELPLEFYAEAAE
ncbi:HAMP domain-containing histidine kinase [Leucobacter sp. UCMA 4100]|uniref:sensor histidine kinase n=1 Tax=Leucobacter sp. UCMA 4100 TaxID=2810534 RepID=UPI0022EB6ABE|nr:HAMP domain-containing sensor histidine kinase [Leucobacter sp. UCMA 4100]MDA3147464.1 HAMP domain-containing histidine kinase [Leucobacter sp. UCMA 4100]